MILQPERKQRKDSTTKNLIGGTKVCVVGYQFFIGPESGLKSHPWVKRGVLGTKGDQILFTILVNLFSQKILQ